MMIKAILWLVVMCVLMIGGVACGGETAVDTTSVVPTTAPVAETAVNAIEPAAETAVPATVPTAVPTTEATAVPVAAASSSGDAQTDVIGAMQKMIGQPYRSETIVTTADGNITLIGEFSPPDSVHVSTQTEGFSSEMILIGAEGWQAMDGVWQAMPPESAKAVAESVSPSALLVQLQATMSNPQTIGQQQLNGRDVWVYQYDTNTEGITSTAVLYIDAATGLPVQQDIVGNAGGIASTTVQTITYDDPISIVAPTP